MKIDLPASHKTIKPDNPFTQSMIKESSIESEELVKRNIQSSIRENKQTMVSSSTHESQVLTKSDLNDFIMTKKVRRSVRENLVEIGELPTESFSSGTPVLVSGQDISKYFLDKSAPRANASLAASMKSANTDNQYQVMKKASSGLEQQAQSVDLGTALTYQLFKYQDATGKYFKLAVKVKDATLNFPVIPKEMIFLLDASGSIGPVRLAQSEEGLIYSIKNLNPGDRFNILVFKNKTESFSPTSVEPTAENVTKAIQFLHDLKSWSTTDIYDSLRTSIDVKDPFVPSYRVVITDGFPTTGIVDAMHVINGISKINDNKVSIFTFGGGVSVDPYMLDFIAFKNRGWSRVVDRELMMRKELTALYNEIKDPLLLNVRYYSSGLNEKEIFPQTMPDFFKGSQFEVYGKYTDENRFVLQVRGEMVHEKKEFLVKAALNDALPGDKQIAHDWAFHKIYYLIGQLQYNEDNGPLVDQIHALSTQFHIITPYSINYHSHPKAAAKAAPAKK